MEFIMESIPKKVDRIDPEDENVFIGSFLAAVDEIRSMFHVVLVETKKEHLFECIFLYVGEHGGTEFPVIIEQTCLTVLGMDTGSTKVALPFSVMEFFRNLFKMKGLF